MGLHDLILEIRRLKSSPYNVNTLISNGRRIRRLLRSLRSALFPIAFKETTLFHRRACEDELSHLLSYSSSSIALMTILQSSALLEALSSLIFPITDHFMALQHFAALNEVLLMKESINCFGIDFAEARDSSSGHTLLHIAAMEGSSSVLRYLLDECGAAINPTDGVGRTPLFHASLQGHLSSVTLFLERGALVSYKDDKGLTPLSALALKLSLSRHSLSPSSLSFLMKSLLTNPLELWQTSQLMETLILHSPKSVAIECISLAASCPSSFHLPEVLMKVTIAVISKRRRDLLVCLLDSFAYSILQLSELLLAAVTCYTGDCISLLLPLFTANPSYILQTSDDHHHPLLLTLFAAIYRLGSSHGQDVLINILQLPFAYHLFTSLFPSLASKPSYCSLISRELYVLITNVSPLLLCCCLDRPTALQAILNKLTIKTCPWDSLIVNGLHPISACVLGNSTDCLNILLDSFPSPSDIAIQNALKLLISIIQSQRFSLQVHKCASLLRLLLSLLPPLAEPPALLLFQQPSDLFEQRLSSIERDLRSDDCGDSLQQDSGAEKGNEKLLYAQALQRAYLYGHIRHPQTSVNIRFIRGRKRPSAFMVNVLSSVIYLIESSSNDDNDDLPLFPSSLDMRWQSFLNTTQPTFKIPNIINKMGQALYGERLLSMDKCAVVASLFPFLSESSVKSSSRLEYFKSNDEMIARPKALVNLFQAWLHEVIHCNERATKGRRLAKKVKRTRLAFYLPFYTNHIEKANNLLVLLLDPFFTSSSTLSECADLQSVLGTSAASSLHSFHVNKGELRSLNREKTSALTGVSIVVRLLVEHYVKMQDLGSLAHALPLLCATNHHWSAAILALQALAPYFEPRQLCNVVKGGLDAYLAAVYHSINPLPIYSDEDMESNGVLDPLHIALRTGSSESFEFLCQYLSIYGCAAEISYLELILLWSKGLHNFIHEILRSRAHITIDELFNYSIVFGSLTPHKGLSSRHSLHLLLVLLEQRLIMRDEEAFHHDDASFISPSGLEEVIIPCLHGPFKGFYFDSRRRSFLMNGRFVTSFALIQKQNPLLIARHALMPLLPRHALLGRGVRDVFLDHLRSSECSMVPDSSPSGHDDDNNCLIWKILLNESSQSKFNSSSSSSSLARLNLLLHDFPADIFPSIKDLLSLSASLQSYTDKCQDDCSISQSALPFVDAISVVNECWKTLCIHPHLKSFAAILHSPEGILLESIVRAKHMMTLLNIPLSRIESNANGRKESMPSSLYFPFLSTTTVKESLKSLQKYLRRSVYRALKYLLTSWTLLQRQPNHISNQKHAWLETHCSLFKKRTQSLFLHRRYTLLSSKTSFTERGLHQELVQPVCGTVVLKRLLRRWTLHKEELLGALDFSLCFLEFSSTLCQAHILSYGLTVFKPCYDNKIASPSRGGNKVETKGLSATLASSPSKRIMLSEEITLYHLSLFLLGNKTFSARLLCLYDLSLGAMRALCSFLSLSYDGDDDDIGKLSQEQYLAIFIDHCGKYLTLDNLISDSFFMSTESQFIDRTEKILLKLNADFPSEMSRQSALLSIEATMEEEEELHSLLTSFSAPESSSSSSLSPALVSQHMSRLHLVNEEINNLHYAYRTASLLIQCLLNVRGVLLFKKRNKLEGRTLTLPLSSSSSCFDPISIIIHASEREYSSVDKVIAFQQVKSAYQVRVRHLYTAAARGNTVLLRELLQAFTVTSVCSNEEGEDLKFLVWNLLIEFNVIQKNVNMRECIFLLIDNHFSVDSPPESLLSCETLACLRSFFPVAVAILKGRGDARSINTISHDEHHSYGTSIQKEKSNLLFILTCILQKDALQEDDDRLMILHHLLPITSLDTFISPFSPQDIVLNPYVKKANQLHSDFLERNKIIIAAAKTASSYYGPSLSSLEADFIGCSCQSVSLLHLSLQSDVIFSCLSVHFQFKTLPTSIQIISSSCKLIAPKIFSLINFCCKKGALLNLQALLELLPAIEFLYSEEGFTKEVHELFLSVVEESQSFAIPLLLTYFIYVPDWALVLDAFVGAKCGEDSAGKLLEEYAASKPAEVVRQQLKQKHLNKYKHINPGESLLLYAVRRGVKKWVNHLLNLGADPFERNSAGLNALEISIALGYASITAMLAPFFEKEVTAADVLKGCLRMLFIRWRARNSMPLLN